MHSGAFWDDVALKVSGGDVPRTKRTKFGQQFGRFFKSFSKSRDILPQRKNRPVRHVINLIDFEHNNVSLCQFFFSNAKGFIVGPNVVTLISNPNLG